MKRILTLGIFVLLGIGLFTACSKEQLNNRKIHGFWDMVDFQDISYFGISSAPTYTGSMHFLHDNKKGSSGKYHIDFTYVSDSIPIRVYETGNYLIENESEMYLSSYTGQKKVLFIEYATNYDVVLSFPSKYSKSYKIVLKRI